MTVLTAATPVQYDEFLSKYGYSVADGEGVFLPLSFAFISALPFCNDVVDNDQIREAQMFLAYAMSTNGGKFNPAQIAEDKTLIEKGLGRNAIVKKYRVNEALSGTDVMSLLRKVPMAYALLAPYLCEKDATVFTPGIYVV